MGKMYYKEWDKDLEEIIEGYLSNDLSISLKKILKQYHLFLLEEK